ncbi:OmpH family outer membrane protein [Maribius pontilimi]|uniref:OmpH family outer membrane protein n=1 Tax=Palleronia pontilimi TaxID=1964209 RepID=A0A934MCK3_9RHOB|nr:OmpH family outer membrane protein [Palleronia pontilimi]MBJ3762888.1 OmpH family outer membrane protein [Palleronia pontilimi]
MSVSRPRSRSFRRLAAALCLSLASGVTAAAQDARETDAPLRLPVVVVDQERLFDDSEYGQRVLAEIDSRSEELAAENRRIEAELTAEERALTELRKTVSQDVFRARAAAFDARVTQLRAEQDAKLRAVSRLRDEARQTFYGLIGDVLRQILAERGALVLLDRRAVLSAVDAADITPLAIRRIDAEIGDGVPDETQE